MYRTGGVTASRVESDVKAPFMCAFLQLLVYWLGRPLDLVNACESFVPPRLRNLNSLPSAMSLNNI